ncbi:MAG: DUF1802 family protein [Pirellulales bacterium]|nr:DUF1802 family protein [Pirellulales bacterium]
MPQLPPSPWALKDWAAVCAALLRGKQTLLLRKGGIAEEPEGLRFDHSSFWVFPTQFHQNSEALQPSARDWTPVAQSWAESPGRLMLPVFLQSVAVRQICSLDQLAPFAAWHVLSPATVEQRFLYRQPGLWLVLVRAYEPAVPLILENPDQYGGCKSWVRLPEPHEPLHPRVIVGDEQFADMQREFLAE